MKGAAMEAWERQEARARETEEGKEKKGKGEEEDNQGQQRRKEARRGWSTETLLQGRRVLGIVSPSLLCALSLRLFYEFWKEGHMVIL